MDSFKFEFYPNKFEYLKSIESGASNGDSVVFSPTFVGLAPDRTLPTTPQEILAYGTGMPVAAYDTVRYSVPNYKALSI